jgi:glyoxylase-like metal-dependent hydrolase (beta-lactamase superfamily II)
MNVVILKIPCTTNGKEDFLYPVLLQYKHEMVLVDCGYEDSFPLIEKAAAEQGISFSRLTGVVLTHHDMDHVAGLYPLKVKYPGINVYASAIEAACICGQKKSLRLQQAEELDACLPKEFKAAARQFQVMLQQVKPVPVDFILEEKSEWPLADVVDVIPTPGHTPGHLSLYIKKQKTLIAADALVIEDGRLNLANPQFAMDLPEAIASVKKIRQLAIKKLICYHGGVLDNGVTEALDTLISEWEDETSFRFK